LTDLSAFEARYQYGKALNKHRQDHVQDGREHRRGLHWLATLEAVGVSDLVLSRYFPDSTPDWRVTIDHIARSVLTLHADGFAPVESEQLVLRSRGEYQWRPRRRAAPL